MIELYIKVHLCVAISAIFRGMCPSMLSTLKIGVQNFLGSRHNIWLQEFALALYVKSSCSNLT